MPYIPHIRSSTTDTRSLESRETLDILSDSQDGEINEIQARDASLPALHDTLVSIDSRSTQDNLKTLATRQTYILPIPEVYQYGGPSPGVVVGIVLGSVAGFLLLIYLLWALSNNNGNLIRTTGDVEEIDIRRTSDRRSKRARSARSEMSRAEPRRDRVYRTERIIRDVPIRSRSSSPRSRMRDSSRIRETTIVEESRGERRVDGDDIVEVIEEHSELEPPRRKSGRRSSGYERSVVEERVYVEEEGNDDDDARSRRDISGGYRTVDPRQFGGGSFKPHRMR